MYDAVMLYLVIGELLWFGALSVTAGSSRWDDTSLTFGIGCSVIAVAGWPVVAYKVVRSLQQE